MTNTSHDFMKPQLARCPMPSFHNIMPNTMLTDPAYLAVSRVVAPRGYIRTTCDEVATVHDVRIFIMFCNQFMLDPNPDGSMPTRRFQEAWVTLFRLRRIYRDWNPHKYTAIRNHLSKKGYIHWIDPQYQLGFLDENGDYQTGIAAKWHLSESLLREIDNQKSILDDARAEADAVKQLPPLVRIRKRVEQYKVKHPGFDIEGYMNWVRGKPESWHKWASARRQPLPSWPA